MDGINNYWEPPILLTEDIPELKVGVVLGGFSSYDTSAQRIAFRFGSDRFNQGIWLLQTKRIDHLVISGGSGFLLKPELRESVYASKYADEIGIPMRKVLIESESRNTRENAIETKKLLEAEGLSKEPILLITSGYHMPRAIACFEKQGLKVVPYCAESYRNESGVDLSSFIPNPLILAHWNVLMHEWLGYASYWAMGYV
ncbi:YdcF family protein [Salibacteraceae bacterium]|nr:YdcF family protein [Salibacteraceae bacterium]